MENQTSTFIRKIRNEVRKIGAENSVEPEKINQLLNRIETQISETLRDSSSKVENFSGLLNSPNKVNLTANGVGNSSYLNVQAEGLEDFADRILNQVGLSKKI